MSDSDFLSRWSRRKRAASESKAAMRRTEEVTAPPAATMSGGAVAAPAEEEFDLSQLPSIDSITRLTDVTGFLRKEVPVDLARAALRRAWVTDPIIRDFVGLAENAWDFNDPTAMPGFGPLDLTSEQIGELVADIVGRSRRAVDAAPAASAPTTETEVVDNIGVSTPPDDGPPPLRAPANPERPNPDGTAVGQAEPAALQQDQLAMQDSPADVPNFPRRTHGRALPR